MQNGKYLGRQIRPSTQAADADLRLSLRERLCLGCSCERLFQVSSRTALDVATTAYRIHIERLSVISMVPVASWFPAVNAVECASFSENAILNRASHNVADSVTERKNTRRARQTVVPKIFDRYAADYASFHADLCSASISSAVTTPLLRFSMSNARSRGIPLCSQRRTVSSWTPIAAAAAFLESP